MPLPIPKTTPRSLVPTGAQWQTLLRTTPAFAKKKLLTTRNSMLERTGFLDNIVNTNSILRDTRKDVRKYAPYLTEDYARKTFSYDIDLMRRNEAFRQLNDRYKINTDTKIYVPEKYPYLTGPQYRPLDPFTWRLKVPLSKTIQVPLSELKIQKNINRLADLSLTRGWAKLPYEKPKILDVLNEPENIFYEKKGGKIHIKKANRGKFTDYCGGKVTSECIARGKASSSPTIRKRATFAANARKWKHENGGTIEKYQLGKLFRPFARRFGNLGTLRKSLSMQKAAELLDSTPARNAFWYGRSWQPGDIFSASYFTSPEIPMRFGRTVKIADGPGIDNFLGARRLGTFDSKADAITNMSLVGNGTFTPTLNGSIEVMQKLAQDAQKLHSGNMAALVKPEDLSIDSYPLYIKTLQRHAINGEGLFEPVLDNGVPRMIQLNTYGVGGKKSLQRIDRVISELQKQYPDLPGRITVPGSFMGSNFRFVNHFVPAFKYTKLKRGGNI